VEAVRQSTLSAQIAGQVVELLVQVGDSVKAGQVLARIDPRAAEQAVAGSQSQLAEAQAQLATAQRTLTRNEQLFKQGFLSKAAFDQAELDHKAAQARVGALQANAGQASTARSYATISAPFAGVIAARLVERGDMATPGKPMLTLFDPAAMRVVATLPQSSLAQLRMKQAVQVELPAIGQTVAGGQLTLVPLADSRTHSASVRIELQPVPGILPGQFARALFGATAARHLAIPERAVLRRSELNAVYVQGAGGQLQLRQLRLGQDAGDGFVEVLAGLREGDMIALDPVKAGMSAVKP
jgi:RND family efflux transporter MFP subunit